LRGSFPFPAVPQHRVQGRQHLAHDGNAHDPRLLARGAQPLLERPPHWLAHATPAALVEQLIALREKHPYWGARKLLELLRRREAQTEWPAASTVTDILKRAGLVRSPRRRRHAVPPAQPFAGVNEPNDT
jgi:hypothetical protein